MTIEELARSWGAPGGDAKWVIVETDVVDPRIVEAAKAGRRFAAAHLGIAEPEMRFYIAEDTDHEAYRLKYGLAEWPTFDAPEQNGHADRTSRSIGVSAEIAPRLAVEVAAHEVFHLTQAGTDRSAEEKEAKAYGEWVAGVLAPRGVLRTLHVHEGHPWPVKGGEGDVVLEPSMGCVWRNFGSKATPRWVRHFVPCPSSS